MEPVSGDSRTDTTMGLPISGWKDSESMSLAGVPVNQVAALNLGWKIMRGMITIIIEQI